MSTVQQKPTATVPPLAADQRLDRAEFLRRYEDTPRDLKAELIGGVVYVASPVGREHGRSSADTITWLGLYRARAPGVQALDNTTTALDDLGVPQPDAQLRILPAYGGQTRDEGKLLNEDLNRVIATLDRGLASPEHAKFITFTLDPSGHAFTGGFQIKTGEVDHGTDGGPTRRPLRISPASMPAFG
jgi:hypothetical protein